MKTTIEITKCDICKSESNCQNITYPVLFLSDQTEGRPCKPYISLQKIDVCEMCLKDVVRISGYGCQGHNTFKKI